MDYELTQHAIKVIAERAISVEWMERAIFEPDWVLPDPSDPEIEKALPPDS